MGIESIDISKLAGKLQEYAMVADNDGNGKLENKEIELFQDTAKAAGLEETDGYKAIFGSEIKTQTVTTRPEQSNVNLSDKEIKNAYKDVKEAVKKTEKLNPASTMSELKKMRENSKYNPILLEVQDIFNKVQATNYKSKEDVEKIYDTVKEQLKQEGKTLSFYDDVLKSFVEQAKNDQIDKEFVELYKTYNSAKYRGTSVNYEESLDKLKEDLKKKGADGKKAWKTSYTEEAFAKLEDQVKADAQVYVKDRMQNLYDGIKDGTTAGSTIEAELESMSEIEDENIHKAYKSMKKDRKNFKRAGKYLDAKKVNSHITRDQLEDKLGKKLLEKLDHSAYLEEHRNADGTYDLSELSEKVQKRVGSDYLGNRAVDTQMSELEGVRRVLVEIGVKGEDFSDKDAKKLLKFAGIQYEKKDHMPKIVKTITSGVAGLFGAATSNSKLNVTQTVNITLESAAKADALKKELTEQGIEFSETNLTNGKVGINILQQVISDKTLLNLAKGVAEGLVIGALLDVIFGNAKDEKSCMSVSDYDIKDSTYTNANEYKEYIEKIYPESPNKVKALHALVDAYSEKYGENWHSEFQNLLRSDAGIGSKLNPDECKMLKYQDVKVKGNDDDGDDGDDGNNEIHNTEDEHTYSTHQKDAVEAEYKAVPVIDGSITSWKKIAGQYDCLIQKYGLENAIRMIKIAQAINNGDYSKENMEKLLELSNKGHNNLRNIEGVDFNAYMSAIRATYLPALEKDSDGKPIDGTGVKVPVELAECTRDASKSLKARRDNSKGPVVAPTGNAADRIKIRDGQAAEYYARFDGGAVQRYPSMADRDNAVANFKQKHPKAKVEKWKE